MARGHIINTSNIDNPARLFKDIVAYVGKYPERASGAQLDYLTQEDGCRSELFGDLISLRFDIEFIPMNDDDFVFAMKQLSRQAFIWDRDGYFDEALFGE